jgi:hypothetical protein
VETDQVDLTPGGANNANNLPIDPTIQKVFSFYPVPASSGDGIDGTAFFPSSSRQDSYETVAKIDHKINSKHSFSGRYGYDHFFDPNPFHADILPNNVGGVNEKGIQQGVAANLTSMLTPTLVNNFVFGWNKNYNNFGCTGLSALDSVGPANQFGIGYGYYFAAPFQNFDCDALVANGQWRKTGTTSYGDNITWVRGNHTLKFGADFRNIGEQGPDSFFSRRELTMETFASPSFPVTLINQTANDSCFNPNFADCTLDNAASAFYGFVGGDFAAEFFNKNQALQSSDNKLFRQHEYDWYGQDSWKVRRNLTLNLGLRYQLDGVPYEQSGNLSNLLSALPIQNFNSLQPGQPVTLSLVGPGTGNMLYKQDYSNFEPRVGVSWDPFGDGKTSVRAAFGIFHDRVFGNLFGNARGNPPFEQFYNQNPFNTLSLSFPDDFFFPGSGPLPTVIPTLPVTPAIADGSHLNPVIFNTHFRNTASNNWNFGIQRELPSNTVVDLAYVASEGHFIPRQIDGNPPNPALVNELLQICSNPNDPRNTTGCTTNNVSGIQLYEGADVFGSLPFNAVLNNAMVQPFYQVSVANSIYNSLQLKVTHRMSHGLQIQGSYTWAHGIDNGEDPLVPGSSGNRTFPRNSLNLAQDRGNSDYDIRHIAVFNYIWEVPFGKGKGFLNSGVIGKILEGWQFSGITTVQTGHPFEVRGSVDSQRTGISAWAYQVGNPFGPLTPTATCTGQESSAGKAFFSNPCAFAEPVIGGGPSNVGRNQFYGPGLVNSDLVWSKNTKITERVSAQLRVEGYNIFNHPHFTSPGADLAGIGNLLNSGLFGIITSTVSQPDGTTSARQLQVALKVTF